VAFLALAAGLVAVAVALIFVHGVVH
jgi:hypothetical protein